MLQIFRGWERSVLALAWPGWGKKTRHSRRAVYQHHFLHCSRSKLPFVLFSPQHENQKSWSSSWSHSYSISAHLVRLKQYRNMKHSHASIAHDTVRGTIMEVDALLKRSLLISSVAAQCYIPSKESTSLRLRSHGLTHSAGAWCERGAVMMSF